MKTSRMRDINHLPRIARYYISNFNGLLSGTFCTAVTRTPGCFMIEQQGQPLGMAETGGVAIAIQVGEGMGHPGQAELVQLIKSRVFEHRRSSQW